MGSSWTRGQTSVPCLGRQILNHWTTKEAPLPILDMMTYTNNTLSPGSKLTSFLVSHLSFITGYPTAWKLLFYVFCPGFSHCFKGTGNSGSCYSILAGSRTSQHFLIPFPLLVFLPSTYYLYVTQPVTYTYTYTTGHNLYVTRLFIVYLSTHYNSIRNLYLFLDGFFNLEKGLTHCK